MKSFLHGRSVQHGNALRSLSSPGSDASMAQAKVKGHSGAAAGPTVECVKQGEKVVRLIVTCSCGERIEIECLYPTGQ